MEDREYMDLLISQAKTAQKAIENYTQEQVDALVKAMGKVIYDNGEMLAKEALEETRLGTLQGKIRKNALPGMLWQYLKDKKSVGVLEDDPVNRILTIAKPMGVVASIAPSTNPTSTSVFNSMQAVKSRNAVIVAPHPRAKKVTAHGMKLMQAEVEKLGGPKNLLQCIEEPSIALSGLLMANADIVAATGGYGMVKAAYSSGRPAYGVGQGNVQCIIDEDYKKIDSMVADIQGDRMNDNGTACTGTQVVYIPRARKDEILNAFKAAGCYIIDDQEVIDKLRPQIFINGSINRDIVGQSPYKACQIMGVDIPENTTMLMLELKKHAKDEILCQEIMFPVVRFIAYDKFEDAVAMAKDNLLIEGAGHTSSIYSDNDERIKYTSTELPVGRIVVCQPGGAGVGNRWNNGLVPTLSAGCGSWGNNSISENLSYKHFLNVTKVSYVIPDAKVPTAEEIWA
ncbi:MAG: aldehyde dehydrogenase family protein [Clostridiaceae bacterium]